MLKKDADASAPRVAGDPVWYERRPLGVGGFGCTAYESRVTQAPTSPSPEAVQVADSTPQYTWTAGRAEFPGTPTILAIPTP